MADATSVLVERFGYALDFSEIDNEVDEEQVQAQAQFANISEEQARADVISMIRSAAMDRGYGTREAVPRVVAAVGSHGASWLIDAVDDKRYEEALALLSLGAYDAYDPDGADIHSQDNMTALQSGLSTRVSGAGAEPPCCAKHAC